MGELPLSFECLQTRHSSCNIDCRCYCHSQEQEAEKIEIWAKQDEISPEEKYLALFKAG
jgi:hypothetical protein